MTLGGKRQGAGRKKGLTNRPIFRNAVTEAQANRLIAKAIKMADEGDTNMLKFVLEQIYGKAVQPLGNEDGKALLISFDATFTPSTPKEHS